MSPIVRLHEPRESMSYAANPGDNVRIVISRADDGVGAYKDGKMFARANFGQSSSGEFSMPDNAVSIRLEIWNVSGGWYGAHMALFIGDQLKDSWIVDEGPALMPSAVAWHHEFAIEPASLV